MFFQGYGDVRQGPDLVVRQAGGPGLLRGQGHFLQPSALPAHQGPGLLGNPGLLYGQVLIPGHHKEVRGDGAVHGVFAQTPHRGDQHRVVLRRMGVQGERHPAGPGGAMVRTPTAMGKSLMENCWYFQ